MNATAIPSASDTDYRPTLRALSYATLGEMVEQDADKQTGNQAPPMNPRHLPSLDLHDEMESPRFETAEDRDGCERKDDKPNDEFRMTCARVIRVPVR